MSDSIVAQFARLLADEENDAKRAALVKRAQLLAMNQADLSAFEPPVRDLGTYLDTPIEVPPSLVWPTICVRGEVTATLGRAGKGKTTLNQNRIYRWAAGRPMFESFIANKHPHPPEDVGLPCPYLLPSHPLKTLIIENEGAAGMFHQKMGTLLNDCDDDILTDDDRKLIRENVYIWGDGGYSGLKLDDPNMLAQVRAGIEKVEPDIVFIEPFRSLWRGEENSSTDMAVVVDNLIGAATDYNCAVILSHHERKGNAEDGDGMDRARGSTVLEGAVAVMENFASVKGGDFRELSWSKARYLQSPPSVRLEYDPANGWYRHVEEGELEQHVKEALYSADEPLNLAALAEWTGESKSKLRRLCEKMADGGSLKKMPSTYSGDGSTGIRYRLPSADNDEGDGALGIG